MLPKIPKFPFWGMDSSGWFGKNPSVIQFKTIDDIRAQNENEIHGEELENAMTLIGGKLVSYK